MYILVFFSFFFLSYLILIPWIGTPFYQMNIGLQTLSRKRPFPKNTRCLYSLISIYYNQAGIHELSLWGTYPLQSRSHRLFKITVLSVANSSDRGYVKSCLYSVNCYCYLYKNKYEKSKLLVVYTKGFHIMVQWWDLTSSKPKRQSWLILVMKLTVEIH